MGEGSFGRVDLYEDDVGNEYAVKTFLAGLTSESLREISILTYLSQFNHPNIIPLIDTIYDENEKSYHIVMPYATQGDLAHYLKRNKVMGNAELLKNLLFQLASGVAFMHGKNVMNRDLKPQNVLVFNDNNFKIADFGLARTNICQVTGYTELIMTLWYRAPEVIFNCSYTEKADVWSLGCIFAEVALGKVLFRAADLVNLIWRILLLLGYDEMTNLVKNNACQKEFR